MLVGEIKYGMPLSWSMFTQALGYETKFINDDETEFRPIFRKGLYASRDISAGEILTPDMIISLRPKLKNAAPSEDYPLYVGAVVETDMKQYEGFS